MRPLPTGKIPIDILSRTVLRLTGARSERVATPPLPGLDFAAIKIGSGYMVVSADPVTGVVEEIGRYAMCVSANDVATSGNRPQFAESVVLLPEGADGELIKAIAGQMHEEAKRLGIAIVGGHTEVTPGLRRPIVMVTAFGFADGYVSSRDAREGDAIMLTKTAGLEGTAVLTRNKDLLRKLSVVDEAEAAYQTGFVHAMHDCTEGGFLGAIFEMSLASGLGFEVREDKVPVAPATRSVCRRLSLDPLKLIGSGALLLAVESGKEDAVKDSLSRFCQATPVGKFTKKGRVLLHRTGRRQAVNAAPEDELWRVVSRPARVGDRVRG